MQTQTAIRKSLDSFLAKFPLDASGWGQATGELPEIYKWLLENVFQFSHKRLPSQKHGTPAQWTTNYRSAIEELFGLADKDTRLEFGRAFSHWLN